MDNQGRVTGSARLRRQMFRAQQGPLVISGGQVTLTEIELDSNNLLLVGEMTSEFGVPKDYAATNVIAGLSECDKGQIRRLIFGTNTYDDYLINGMVRPLAYYTGTDQTLADESGNSNTLTVAGGVTYAITADVEPYEIHTDGSAKMSASITVAVPAVTQSFTLFFKMASAPAGITPLMEQGDLLVKVLTDGTVSFSADAGVSAVVNYVSLCDNAWHHIVAVQESAEAVSLYIDGELFQAGTGTYAVSQTATLYIGNSSAVACAFACCGFYNIALNAGQVTRLYDEGHGIHCRQLNSFELPGGQNILCEDGDIGEFYSQGDGYWKCFRYTRGGTPSSPSLNLNACRAATTAALAAHTYSNPSAYEGLIARIIFSANGTQTIDGITLAVGDFVLVKNEGNAENGIYVCQVAGDGSTPCYLIRSYDANNPSALYGAIVFVSAGTTNANTVWCCTNRSPSPFKTEQETGIIPTTTWANATSLTGIRSLNALTGTAQTFTNDTNVTIVSGGTSHVVTWSGTLALARLANASAASVLLGRGSAGGAGVFQEITLGANLTMTNQVLSAAASTFTINGLSADDIVLADSVPFYDASGADENKTTLSRLLGQTTTSLCEGRLTLTSGTSVTTTDVTGATSIYFAPYNGDRISIYDGTRLCLYSFTQLTLALGTLVKAMAYDIFIYDNAGTLTLESLKWKNLSGVTITIAAPGVVTWTAHGMATGNTCVFTTTGALPTGLAVDTEYYVTVVDANTFKLSTTRALLAAGTFITTSGSQSGTHTGNTPQQRNTALVAQNGAWYKTGDLTRRYLGTFHTTTTTTTEDSVAHRFLWNAHNRMQRLLKVVEGTDSWNYSTATWRQANASAANQFDFVIGLSEDLLNAKIAITGNNSNGPMAFSVGVGIDSTNTNTALIFGVASAKAISGVVSCDYSGFPGVGYHAAVWLEISLASGTTTWYGDDGKTYIQAGMIGWVLG